MVAPVAARIDAVKSIVIATCAELLLVGKCPGHRSISGTRIPPSHRVLFRLLSGALRESHSPPLSFVKMTSVFLVRPRSSSGARMVQSNGDRRSLQHDA